GYVYSSANGGASSWTSQQLCNGRITALAFVGTTHLPVAACAATAPTDPSGIFLSNDGGATWMSTSNGTNGIPTSVAITAVAADASGAVFYAGGANGSVYRSTDHVIWTPTSSGSGSSPITSIAIDPTNNAHVWASSTKVFVTTNGGGMWTVAS